MMKFFFCAQLAVMGLLFGSSCSHVFLAAYRADAFLSSQIEFRRFLSCDSWKWLMVSYYVRERASPSLLKKRTFFIDDPEVISSLIENIHMRELNYYSLGVNDNFVFKPQGEGELWKMSFLGRKGFLLQRGFSSTSVSVKMRDSSFYDAFVNACIENEKQFHASDWVGFPNAIVLENYSSDLSKFTEFID